MKRIAFLFAALVAVAVAAPAAAQTTATINVSATVSDSCVILTADDLSFGNYVATADSVASADVTIECNASATYDIDLASTWLMANGGNNLAFQVEDGAGNPVTNVAGTATAVVGDPTVVALNGRIPAGQLVPSGAYNGSIDLTLNF
jgi:spore coat protein U-like protein